MYVCAFEYSSGRDACCVAFKLGFWDGGGGGGACTGISLFLFFTFYTPFLNYSFKHRE